MLLQLFELTGNDHQACAIYDATATVNGATDTHRCIVVDSYTADGKVKTTDVVAFNQAAADAMFG